jgi:putative transposase
MNVLRTVTFKLRLTCQDKESLLSTMRAYTEAFSVSAKWGFENRSWNKVENHEATYKLTRQSIPDLPSSLVQGARDCACEALKAVKAEILPERKPLSAMRYNQRVITVNLEHGAATIATMKGRIKASFLVPAHCRGYLDWIIKSSTISYNRRSREFYLHVSLEQSNPEEVTNLEVLGIDRGIVNIAVCSDNQFFNSKKVKNRRAKNAHLRKELQSKGTPSAKRKLKSLSGRERRFATDVNHCISKQIVNSEYTVFALEDLSKIRVQKRRGKEFDRKLNSWPFYQLEQSIRYKAEALGKHVLLVDARYTSQKCSNCGHTYKGNREGSAFRCRKCGFELHADLNASRNIAQAGISSLGRLHVNQPNVSRLFA